MYTIAGEDAISRYPEALLLRVPDLHTIPPPVLRPRLFDNPSIRPHPGRTSFPVVMCQGACDPQMSLPRCIHYDMQLQYSRDPFHPLIGEEAQSCGDGHTRSRWMAARSRTTQVIIVPASPTESRLSKSPRCAWKEADSKAVVHQRQAVLRRVEKFELWSAYQACALEHVKAPLSCSCVCLERAGFDATTKQMFVVAGCTMQRLATLHETITLISSYSPRVWRSCWHVTCWRQSMMHNR